MPTHLPTSLRSLSLPPPLLLVRRLSTRIDCLFCTATFPLEKKGFEYFYSYKKLYNLKTRARDTFIKTTKDHSCAPVFLVFGQISPWHLMILWAKNNIKYKINFCEKRKKIPQGGMSPVYFPLFELESSFLEKTPKWTGKFALLILINIVVFILKYTYLFNRI